MAGQPNVVELLTGVDRTPFWRKLRNQKEYLSYWEQVGCGGRMLLVLSSNSYENYWMKVLPLFPIVKRWFSITEQGFIHEVRAPGFA